MKKCPYCGAPIENKHDSICAYCGSPYNGRIDDDSQYSTEEHYDPRISPDQQHAQTPYHEVSPQEQMRRAMAQRLGQEHLSEASSRAMVAKFLGILSLFFHSMFVLAIVTLVMANQAKKSSDIDARGIKNANIATTLGIISICLGVLFFISQIAIWS